MAEMNTTRAIIENEQALDYLDMVREAVRYLQSVQLTHTEKRGVMSYIDHLTNEALLHTTRAQSYLKNERGERVAIASKSEPENLPF